MISGRYLSKSAKSLYPNLEATPSDLTTTSKSGPNKLKIIIIIIDPTNKNNTFENKRNDSKDEDLFYYYTYVGILLFFLCSAERGSAIFYKGPSTHLC